MKTSISTGLLLLNAVANAACPYMDGGAALHKRGGDGSGSSGLPGDDGYLDKFYVDDGNGDFTTTDFGTPVDDTHSLKAGERGPTLLEDFVLRTKITRFDHERVPERAGKFLLFVLIRLCANVFDSPCSWCRRPWILRELW